MSSTIVYPQGGKSFTLIANESIAVFSKAACQVYRTVGYPNVPNSTTLIGTVTNGQTVFGPYTSGATITVQPGATQALVEVGIAPSVQEVTSRWATNGAPNALNATGSLTALMMLGGIITSTTAAAVTATIPTGATLDAAADFDIGDKFQWSVINTGAANDFTLDPASQHTVVGVVAVQELTSVLFETRKTAAATYVTYRIGG